MVGHRKATLSCARFAENSSLGISTAMELSLLLIIIGIVLAVFVHYALGIVCVLIGLVLLIWPRITAARRV